VEVEPAHPILSTQQTPNPSAQVPLAVPLTVEHSADERQVPLDPLDAPHGSLENLTILSSPSLSCLLEALPPKAGEIRRQELMIRMSMMKRGLVIAAAAQLLKLLLLF